MAAINQKTIVGYIQGVPMSKQEIIERCEKLVKRSEFVYNLTICPNNRRYDDLECWHIEEDVKSYINMSLKSKTIDYHYDVVGAYEKFPNNPTRAHVHCQLYIYAVYLERGYSDKQKSTMIGNCMDKLSGLLNKKVGNTKIAKNMPYVKRAVIRFRHGLSPLEDTEYTEYYHYMLKQLKYESDFFAIN